MKKLKDQVDESLIDLNKSEILLKTQETEDLRLQVENHRNQLLFQQAGDFHNGVLTFAGEINDATVLHMAESLRRMARLRPGKPIRIEMNCAGGYINYGFHLFDVIAEVGKATPVTIAVRGQAASMAGVVLQSAHKRLVGPNAYVMLHRASFGVEGNADTVEDSIEEVRMFEARIYELVAKRSGKTVAFWKKELGQRRNVWYTSEQAVKMGLADSIG